MKRKIINNEQLTCGLLQCRLDGINLGCKPLISFSSGLTEFLSTTYFNFNISFMIGFSCRRTFKKCQQSSKPFTLAVMQFQHSNNLTD